MTVRIVFAALAALLAAGAPAAAQAPLVAARVPGAGPILEPGAPAWKDARAVTVAMLPQTVTLPHQSEPAVKALIVRAIHNGGWVAFLIQWKDPTKSDRVILDNFGDQVAIQLPVDIKATPPSPMMGNPGGRVNIMQWRAAFQKDIEDGHAPTRSSAPPTPAPTPARSASRTRSRAAPPRRCSTRWPRGGAR